MVPLADTWGITKGADDTRLATVADKATRRVRTDPGGPASDVPEHPV